MLEKNRRFKKCIFCGSQKFINKEHIFGKSIARRFENLPNWSVPLSTEQQKLVHKKKIDGGGSILNITQRIVCEKCNKGELKDTIDNALISLEQLFSGNSFQFDPKQQYHVRRYLERIGIIIDVSTSNLDIDAKRKRSNEHKINAFNRQHSPIITSKERETWLEGEFSTQISCYIGVHDGVLGLNPEPRITSYSDALELNLIGKRVAFVINKLAVCILIGDAKLPTNKLYQIEKECQAINWPNSSKLSYSDIFNWYDKNDPILLAYEELLNNQEYITEIESLSIKKNRLTIPEHLIGKLNDYVKFYSL